MLLVSRICYSSPNYKEQLSSVDLSILQKFNKNVFHRLLSVLMCYAKLSLVWERLPSLYFQSYISYPTTLSLTQQSFFVTLESLLIKSKKNSQDSLSIFQTSELKFSTVVNQSKSKSPFSRDFDHLTLLLEPQAEFWLWLTKKTWIYQSWKSSFSMSATKC